MSALALDAGFTSILFDLDGTLSDPKEGLVRAVLYALDQLGIAEHQPEELDSFIGPPLRESFQRRYGMDSEGAEEALRLYRVYYSDRGLYENAVYPGIPELLGGLRTRGFRLFVATSKPTVFAVQILAHFGLDVHFEGIVGANLDSSRNEKAEVIAHLLTTYSVDPAQAVMVGDRKYDLIGAQAHGMRSIGVEWGFGGWEELQAHGAHAIAADVAALQRLLGA
jgi:phosphoglycolate phosphatase